MLLISFFSLLLLMSFKADTDTAPKELIGYWIFDSYIEAENVLVYKKVNDFNKNKGGMAFLDKAVYIDRNGGPCGTPPVMYSNESGSWTYKKDVLSVKYESWMGMRTKNFVIVSVSDKKLKLRDI